jgi:hypothetical protein
VVCVNKVSFVDPRSAAVAGVQGASRDAPETSVINYRLI